MEAPLTFFGFDLWATALVFMRAAGAIMLLPGFGEATVPARIRLVIALLVAISMAPVLAPNAPPMPQDLGVLAGFVIGETLIGVMIGALARMIMAALATAGQVIAMETGLSFAQTADPTMNGAGVSLGVFLGVMGTVLIFVTDMHHEFLKATLSSYQVFPLGGVLSVGEASEAAVTAASASFLIGVQIALPLLAAGLVFRLGLGVLSRLIPQIQVFFVTMPLQVLGGLLIMALALSSGMLLWLSRLDEFTRTLQ
jgi:flagellar biosynthetic protein FliR